LPLKGTQISDFALNLTQQKAPIANVLLNCSRKVSALTVLSPHHVKGCGCIKSVTTTSCLPDAATLLSRAPNRVFNALGFKHFSNWRLSAP
jgi:hypothetical protein